MQLAVAFVVADILIKCLQAILDALAMPEQTQGEQENRNEQPGAAA